MKNKYIIITIIVGLILTFFFLNMNRIVHIYYNYKYDLIYNKAIKSVKDANIHYKLLFYFKGKMEFKKALLLSEKLYNYNEDDVLSLLDAATISAALYYIYQDSKYYDKAIYYVSEIMKNPNNVKNNASTIVGIYFILHKNEKEIKAFIDSFNNELTAFEYYSIADIYLANEMRDKALFYYEKAFEKAKTESQANEGATIGAEYVKQTINIVEKDGGIMNIYTKIKEKKEEYMKKKKYK